MTNSAASGTQDHTRQLVFWLLGGLMSINVAITVAFFSWAASAILSLQTDVAVIKCQLSEDCKKVLTRGGE